jgi:cyclophilin family peptidyl-prolyl cis-trans isomerase
MTNSKNSIISMVLTIFLLTSCFQKDEQKEETPVKKNNGESKIVEAASLPVDANGLSKASIVLKTVHGNVEFKLYPKQAPNTITRIIELVNKGFYDGLVFHRVIPNFVVQTGDPTASGTGGSGKNLKAEFNTIQHIKGTVAMARANDPDSADSQFYIALSTLPHLDQKYTVFGQVISDLSVLDKIRQGDKILSMSFQEN